MATVAAIAVTTTAVVTAEESFKQTHENLSNQTVMCSLESLIQLQSQGEAQEMALEDDVAVMSSGGTL